MLTFGRSLLSRAFYAFTNRLMLKSAQFD
ncbi:hypothetical protein MELB17_23640 [Marinobacter sp. ELB17]|nr:hypothetical protein MELB17_23640 [Marinobacter sp. ELB17]